MKNQVKQGYIKLEVNPDNKKEKVIYLTEEGKIYAEDLILPLFKIEEAAISLLSEEDIKQFSETISTYAYALIDKMNDLSNIIK